MVPLGNHFFCGQATIVTIGFGTALKQGCGAGNENLRYMAKKQAPVA